MREIKFRCWDTRTNKMIQPCASLGQYGLGYFEHPDLDNGCLEWTQYTGIKDKNDREIYEGDIVKFYDKDRDWFAFGVCYYDIEETSFLHTFYEVNKNKVDFRFQRPPKRFWSNKSFSFEVIGNIYENPELLE